jgi:PAT family beta-lactamase induction signal transducer AmpG
VDAYRREDLSESELSTGFASYMWGYRLGMVVISGGGLYLVDILGWTTVFQGAAALILLGPITLIWSPEPAHTQPLRTFSESVTGPLRDFFLRRQAFLLLAFVLFYKLGEQLISSLNTVFFMEAGYTKQQIGLVVKAYGLIATMAGVSLAGLIIKRLGILPSLWLFGWLQLLNSAWLTALWLLPSDTTFLGIFISLDHLIVGGSSLVFITFLASQTKLAWSATQYAILTSLMALPGSFLSGPSGWLVGLMGWPGFYLLGAILCLPGLFMLRALIRGGLKEISATS